MTDELNYIEFQPYPKTTRLFGDKNIVVSEKIDGSNAAIQIIPLSSITRKEWDADDEEWIVYSDIPAYQEEYITTEAHGCALVAQSRNRIITPGPNTDNANFALWVQENAEGLVEALGTGIHRGEWWGNGIQRGYGLQNGDKRFSLFAIDRYKDRPLQAVSGLATVPELYRGPFDTDEIKAAVDDLIEEGSYASPGYQKAEGVIVYHEASRQVFKVMCENDSIAKGSQR